jgi:CheY-like chemotaxis protein
VAQDDNLNPKTQHLGTRTLAPTEPSNLPVIPRSTGPLDRELPWVIEFRIVGTVTTLQARVRESMTIGRRTEPNSHEVPDIDLTPHGAFANGISRSHASILIQDERLMIKDLGSTNGTRLNGAVCEPHKEYRLRHGDEITLGRLRMQVSFAVVPSMLGAVNTEERQRIELEQTTPIVETSEVEIPVVGSGQKVLIVEDDQDVGAVFSLALQKAGYAVTLVDTVANGLGVIFQGMPDLIILDLMLPDMSGIDLLRYVRKQKTSQRVPMLVVSSATAGFQANQAREAGADRFLGKPLAVEELVSAVSTALQN